MGLWLYWTPNDTGENEYTRRQNWKLESGLAGNGSNIRLCSNSTRGTGNTSPHCSIRRRKENVPMFVCGNHLHHNKTDENEWVKQRERTDRFPRRRRSRVRRRLEWRRGTRRSTWRFRPSTTRQGRLPYPTRETSSPETRCSVYNLPHHQRHRQFTLKGKRFIVQFQIKLN